MTDKRLQVANVRLSDSEMAAVRDECERTNVTVSQFLRSALQAALGGSRRRPFRASGRKGRSGPVA
jgi:hypothetical protein